MSAYGTGARQSARTSKARHHQIATGSILQHHDSNHAIGNSPATANVPILELPRPLSGQWWSEPGSTSTAVATSASASHDAGDNGRCQGQYQNTAPSSGALGLTVRPSGICGQYLSNVKSTGSIVSLDRRRLLVLISSGGVLTAVSTRAAKEKLPQPRRERDLAKIDRLPITEWNYQTGRTRGQTHWSNR